MKAAKTVGAIACLDLLTGASSAPDWKYVGGDQMVGPGGAAEPLDVFVLANGVTALPQRHIQVWTQPIAAADLTKKPLDKAGVDRAASEFIAGYRPPFTVGHPAKQAQVLSVITTELEADETLALRRSKRLVEIDCPNAMLHSIRTVTYTDGKPVTDDKAAPWIHIPPGSIGTNITAIACH